MNEAAEFRLDAEKHLGEIMEKAPKAKGTRGQLRGRKPSGGAKTEPPEDDVPTLAESGIDWKLSSRAQLLGTVRQPLATPPESTIPAPDDSQAVLSMIVPLRAAYTATAPM